MTYEVTTPILGEKNISKVTLSELDDLMSILKTDTNNTITLINPFILTDYDIKLPKEVYNLLDISDNSSLSVYVLIDMKDSPQESIVDLQKAFIFNNDNKKMAQIDIENEKQYKLGELL